MKNRKERRKRELADNEGKWRKGKESVNKCDEKRREERQNK
jgi:hypothetical protein